MPFSLYETRSVKPLTLRALDLDIGEGMLKWSSAGLLN